MLQPWAVPTHLDRQAASLRAFCVPSARDVDGSIAFCAIPRLFIGCCVCNLCKIQKSSFTSTALARSRSCCCSVSCDRAQLLWPNLRCGLACTVPLTDNTPHISIDGVVEWCLYALDPGESQQLSLDTTSTAYRQHTACGVLLPYSCHLPNWCQGPCMH